MNRRERQPGEGQLAELRLVVGAGATGRTHHLRAWVESAADNPDDPTGTQVVWLTGSPLAPIAAADLSAVLERVPSLLVIDDLQWAETEALELLAATVKDAGGNTAVFASRRPGVGIDSSSEAHSAALELMSELLTRERPADRVGLLGVDQFAAALSMLRTAAAERRGEAGGGVLANDVVERLHRVTAGSVGLAADAEAAAWDGDRNVLPSALVDAVNARIRRAGPEAAQLVAVWAIVDQTGAAKSLSTALRALPDDTDPDRAERGARVGGLLTDDGTLIPTIALCAGADLTGSERAHLHDRVAEAIGTIDRLGAARHLLEGAGDVPNATQILASAAMNAALTTPDEAPRYIDRAERLGLAEAEGSLLRALAAFHSGSPDALAHLDHAQTTIGAVDDDRTAILGYGIDTRDLRFDDAAKRAIVGELAAPLHALAAGLLGQIPQGDGATDEDVATTPLGQMLSSMAQGVHRLAAGEISLAVGSFSTAADDFDRLEPTVPFGITPHTLGALTGIAVGDLAAVELLTEQAITHLSGGAGEELTHRLLQAYGRLVTGDYADALALLREHATLDFEAGPDASTAGSGNDDGEGGDNGADGGSAAAGEARDDLHDLTDDVDRGRADSAGANSSGVLLSQRDRLLVAALEAAIARRSGDTTRLRAAWRRSEEALIRPSTSWLFTDPFTELLAAGARLGDRRRVEPIVERLVAQGRALSTDGPGPVASEWLRLQVAIAADDHETVADAAERMKGYEPSDDRSQARCQAAGIWATIVVATQAGGATATEDDVVDAANRLSAVNDGWEASRLLGQAALDEPDPKAARRLLEMARVSATDHVDEQSSDGLSALGLSERESEVALLVIEGRTHKEVGAQLFISPKTVEHHVAKIRQKVGASSRAELLSIIREAVGQA